MDNPGDNLWAVDQSLCTPAGRGRLIRRPGCGPGPRRAGDGHREPFHPIGTNPVPAVPLVCGGTGAARRRPRSGPQGRCATCWATSGDIEVVAEAGTVAEALVVAAAAQPGCRRRRHPPAGRRRRHAVPQAARGRRRRPRCLVLTAFDDEQALVDAIEAGVSGYLLKQVRGQDLVTAVREVAAGRSLLDPVTTARVLERMRRAPTRRTGRPDRARAARAGTDRRGPVQPGDRRSGCSWPRRP